jgi:putative oxidoreductase
MNVLLSLGKYLFAIPFAIFGIFHFMSAEAMKGMAFGSTILVYLTGAALIAAAVSMLIGKMDKLASVLLAVMMLLFVVLIHGPAVAGGGDAAQASMPALLKDIMLAGASLLYAQHAKDKAMIG